MMCCKSRCPSGAHTRIGNTLYMIAGGRVTAAFRIIATPSALATAYEQMVGFTNLTCPPEFVVVHDAHGVGGFFTPGLVVVGWKDAGDIADGLWREHGLNLQNAVMNVGQEQGVTVTRPRDFVRMAVAGRILGHELGHAMRHAGAFSPFSDEEAAADWYAARFDRLRGKHGQLGEAIFASIGCDGPRCTHPTGITRAKAYRHGYQFQAA